MHLLIIPEHHVDSFREVGEFSARESKRMLEFVAETAVEAGLTDYRVQVNVGPGAGQTVKLCNQLVCGINIQAICEALAKLPNVAGLPPACLIVMVSLAVDAS